MLETNPEWSGLGWSQRSCRRPALGRLARDLEPPIPGRPPGRLSPVAIAPALPPRVLQIADPSCSHMSRARSVHLATLRTHALLEHSASGLVPSGLVVATPRISECMPIAGSGPRRGQALGRPAHLRAIGDGTRALAAGPDGKAAGARLYAGARGYGGGVSTSL